MEQRLIDEADVQKLLKERNDFLKAYSYATQMNCETEIDENLRTIQDIRDKVPTVEAEPIRHGKWIEIPDDGIYHAKCSVCGWKAEWAATDVSDEPYCPHCGARLEVLS